uniref:Proteasome subunit beta n=1 Tax=Fagus sylvatica TaxID=28930 RepID=A0A2N9GHE1_FAGSY
MDSSQAEHSILSSETASERTLNPYVTGTSVVAIKYKDGILMAADMGGSYGYTLRYKSVERLKPAGKHSLLGASGEISDFQEILRYLDELILYDNMWDDGNTLGPKEVHNYLTRVMYNRRNKFNPLWNSLVLGGVKNGQKYLGMVSMIGVNFEDNHVATGFGNHLARPILRDEWHDNLSFEDGVKLLEKCMRVLLYRDTTAVNKLQPVKFSTTAVNKLQATSGNVALKMFGFLDSSPEGHHSPPEISTKTLHSIVRVDSADVLLVSIGIGVSMRVLIWHVMLNGNLVLLMVMVLEVEAGGWAVLRTEVLCMSSLTILCEFDMIIAAAQAVLDGILIAKITEEGVTISQPYSLKTFWGFSAFENPTVGAEGSW